LVRINKIPGHHRWTTKICYSNNEKNSFNKFNLGRKDSEVFKQELGEKNTKHMILLQKFR